jgi:hypothetical protein
MGWLEVGVMTTLEMSSSGGSTDTSVAGSSSASFDSCSGWDWAWSSAAACPERAWVCFVGEAES